MDPEVQGDGRRWEGGVERTWEEIGEREDGSISLASIQEQHRRNLRRLREDLGSIQRHMIRQLLVIIDCSESMNNIDLRPTRIQRTTQLLKDLITDYFNQNPISQMGLLTTCEGRAHTLSTMNGSANAHLQAIEEALNVTKALRPRGEPSIQNSLELALRSLKNCPSHASKEVVLLYGNLTSCDPEDIHGTIQKMADANIKCSVIHLAAAVKVCETLCKETGGTHTVVLDENHYREVLMQVSVPPPASDSTIPSLLPVGFPNLEVDNSEVPLAGFRPGQAPYESIFQSHGYFCPRCKTKHGELPTDCKVCGLQLVSAPHLARSYHHLFPVPKFKEVTGIPEGARCYGCEIRLEDDTRSMDTSDKQNTFYQCPRCGGSFCYECDVVIHESIHNCPTCCNAGIVVKSSILGTI